MMAKVHIIFVLTIFTALTTMAHVGPMSNYDQQVYDYYEGLTSGAEILANELEGIPTIVGFQVAMQNLDQYTYSFLCAAKSEQQHDLHINLHIDGQRIEGHRIDHPLHGNETQVFGSGLIIMDQPFHKFTCTAETAFGSTEYKLEAHAKKHVTNGKNVLPKFIATFHERDCEMNMTYGICFNSTNLNPNMDMYMNSTIPPPLPPLLAENHSLPIAYVSCENRSKLNEINCDLGPFQYELESTTDPALGIVYKFETINNIFYGGGGNEVHNFDNATYEDYPVQPPQQVEPAANKIASVGFELADTGAAYLSLKLTCSAEHRVNLITWYTNQLDAQHKVDTNRIELELNLSKSDIDSHEYICQIGDYHLHAEAVYLTLSSEIRFDNIQKYGALFHFNQFPHPDQAIFEAHLNVQSKKGQIVENVFIMRKDVAVYPTKVEDHVFRGSAYLHDAVGKWRFYTDQNKRYQFNFEVSRKSLLDF